MATKKPSREEAMVNAYLAGRKITDIEKEFGVGRSTIYHVLRRSGRLPSRTQNNLTAESKDLALAGLHELIDHQDHRIVELEAIIVDKDKEIAKLKRQLNKALLPKPRLAGNG